MHYVLHVLSHTKNVTYRVTILKSQLLRWPLARAQKKMVNFF